jgi:hypothetical protein
MSYLNPYKIGTPLRAFAPAYDVAGLGTYRIGTPLRAFAPAYDVSGLGADVTAGYAAARDARLARDAQQQAALIAGTPMTRLDPVVIPPAQPFPKALTIALVLAGVAALGVVGYAFVSGRK